MYARHGCASNREQYQEPIMAEKANIPSPAEYERMALELEASATTLREHPEINPHFAERLELLARQMREDQARDRKQ